MKKRPIHAGTAQPAVGFIGQFNHIQVRATLNDRFNTFSDSVEFLDGLAGMYGC